MVKVKKTIYNKCQCLDLDAEHSLSETEQTTKIEGLVTQAIQVLRFIEFSIYILHRPVKPAILAKLEYIFHIKQVVI